MKKYFIIVIITGGLFTSVYSQQQTASDAQSSAAVNKEIEIIELDENDTLCNDSIPDEDEVFFIVENMPIFKGGGTENFRKYIDEKLNYPEEAVQKSIEGRVFVQFVVTARGEVTDVKVVRGVHPLLDAEAVRVISSSPRWTPGSCRGPGVDVAFTFPVNFDLDYVKNSNENSHQQVDNQ